MVIALSIIVAVISVLMVIVVLAQPSKNPGFQGDGGGFPGDALYGKNRGVEALLKRITVVLAILFFGLTITLAIIM